MSIKILHANGTYTDNGAGATLVGGSDRLGDESDLTYITVDGDGVLDYSIGLEPLVDYRVGEPITLHIRAGLTGGGPTPGQMIIFLSGVPTVSTEPAGFSYSGWNTPIFIPIPLDGTPHDFDAVPLTLRPGTTTADVVALLEAGAYLVVNSGFSVDWDTFPTFTVYEAWLEVGVHRRPIQRIHPRGDGARIFPAQATNRIAGGYV